MAKLANKKEVSVSVKDVSKSFGSGDEILHVLKNISLDVYKGELAMIVGPSGCGKTTLLSVIAGTLKAESGTIEVFGDVLTIMSDSGLTIFRSKTIGFIFQQFHLLPNLTIRENVALPLLLQNYNRNQAFKEAEQLLESVGLEGKANKLPKHLSGGQQQRVAIARALIHKPKLLICDEPTSALDFETGKRIMDILKTIATSHDRTVIVVTHDHRIFSYAERIIELNDGIVKNITTNYVHN